MPRLTSLARPLAAALLASTLLLPATAAPAHARSAVVKRQDELLDSYDFIVAGAGTAGLTVADRLSENGNYSVLVVEYGYLDSDPSITSTGPGAFAFGPPSRGNSSSNSTTLGRPAAPEFPPATRFYNISSQPLEALRNRRMGVACGCVVGGSSAVNGMLFDRGSAEDYDAWVWAADGSSNSTETSDGEYAREWGWKNLLPWFRKSVTFHPPTEQMAADYQMTWDMAAWGGDTPIHASYPPYQWPSQQLMWNALKAFPGIEAPKEHADGNAVGVVWTPNSIEPVNRTRSYAKLGHYDADGVSKRSNFHLLPGHRVTRIILDRVDNGSDTSQWAAGGVYIVPRDGDLDGGPKPVKAKREVVLSAGAVHTPQILQRSGLGPADVLKAAGVQVKAELPGVGANLQDHFFYSVSFKWNKEATPNQSMMWGNDSSFREQAELLYNTNKTGPLAAFVSSMALVPLPVVTNKTEAIVRSLLAQDPARYLPNNTHPTVVAGYREQLRALARQYRSRRSAVLEVPFTGDPFVSVIHIKPASRGRITLSPRDDGVNATGRGDAEPLVDWRPLSNPVDRQITAEYVRWVRAFARSPAMVEAFDPVETRPGPDVGSGDSPDDDEALLNWITGVASPSNGHLVGTAALAPLNLGGVVAPDLRVHKTLGLSVADNSVMTLIPGTHTSATAYAIGEKAADLILRRAKGDGEAPKWSV